MFVVCIQIDRNVCFEFGFCLILQVSHRSFGKFLISASTVNSEFLRGLYFRETSHMRSFMKINPSRNDKITLSFIDIGKSCLSREFFTSLMCLLMLFAKIKFSQKFPNPQY